MLNVCLSLIYRSSSPKQKDGKIKREKDIKVEEEDEKKKKEKVYFLAGFLCG